MSASTRVSVVLPTHNRAFCVVDAVFAAFADDSASLDCETAPSLPGLSTRTEMFWFDG